MNSRSVDGDGLSSMLRGFVVLRVIVVSTLLLSAFLIQLTFSISLPLNPVYYLAAFSFSISILAVLSLDRLPPEANAGLQILGDLVVITALVYISGGPESSFTFLYLATVTAGAILLGRRGGLIAAGLAAVFYAVLVDLMYFGALTPIDGSDLKARALTPASVVGNVLLNVAAFVATALLVSAASQKLRDARADVERRKAEIARLQSLHTSVLTSMSSGVLTTDLEGRVTFANPAALELLGITNALDLLGQPVLSLALIAEAAWDRIRQSDVGILRFEGTRRTLGKEAYFGISATALRDGAGRITGRILIFQNLTDLKRLEGEVRLKDKLAAVGELAAGIAHEIRNPLASISGSVQVLTQSAEPGSAEHRLMDIVVKESSRLSAILEDFLRYVRPRERAAEPVDGPAAIRDVLTLLTHSDEVSPKHHISLDLDPESGLVVADPGQLRQIFWNVARNALAAMPHGGNLSVSARLRDGVFTVAMCDEGHGMTDDERDRLFTPFAHSFPGGTGLGLAIVYRIVEEHGGTIRVDTAPGCGTTVTISLPEHGPRETRGVRAPSSEKNALLAATEVV